MVEELPKLLVLSEAQFFPTAYGLSRSLLSTFALYPADRIRFFIPPQLGVVADGRFWDRVEMPSVRMFRNRLGALLSPMMRGLGFKRISRTLSAVVKEAGQFEPDLVVVCSNSLEWFYLGERLAASLNRPIVLYLMDDWIEHEKVWIYNDSPKEIFARLMGRTKGIISVSEALANELKSRYQRPEIPTVVSLNPIDTGELAFEEPKWVRGGKLKVVYAGSIWPMHLDALVRSCEAFKGQENVQVVFHTDAASWQTYESLFSRLNVKNGGSLPFDELQRAIRDAAILLAPVSFRKELEHLTKTSVQTKLTEYMAAGRAIFAHGPEFSPTIKLVDYYRMGVTCTEPHLARAREAVAKLLGNRDRLRQYGVNGFDAVKQDFSRQIVSQRVYEFISHLVSR